MCGICGIYEPKRVTEIPCSVLKPMADTIDHRGPDVGLAFRRLSILDVIVELG